MALLLRCRQCKRFYSPDNPKCPGCDRPWDTRGAPKAFYHDFMWLGVRRRVRLKAKNLHYAKVQETEFDPAQWWEERKKAKIEAEIPTFSEAIPEYLRWCQYQGTGKRGPNRPSTLVSKRNNFDHVKPYFGEKRVKEITDQDIFAFVVAQRPEDRLSR